MRLNSEKALIAGRKLYQSCDRDWSKVEALGQRRNDGVIDIPETKWSAGDKIMGLKGDRAGQVGTLVEPLGVHVSWVKWDKGSKGPAYSVYSFENMRPVR